MKKIKYLYRAFRYRYIVDASEIKFIIRNLKKGDTAVDIGCHKGGYLYWLEKSVGKNGKLFAFEPQVKLYQYVQEISKLFNYKSLTLENKGVSSKNEQVNFFIPITKGGTSPGASIDQVNNSENFNQKTIEVVALDDYFSDKELFPNLIKIDVEGHEKQVILGGLELLKKSHPMLLIESENRHLKNKDILDFFNLLSDIGYKGYFFMNKKLKSINEFHLEIHQKSGEGRFWEKKGYVNNFIFVKKGHNI